MRHKFPIRRAQLSALALAFTLGSALSWALMRVPGRLWAYMTMAPSNDPNGTAYTVAVEAKPLLGIDRNVSGLTYSHSSQTLFAVTNKPKRVIEITPDGRVLRSLPVAFGADLEGISHIKDDLFVLVSETGNEIWGARLNKATTTVLPTPGETLSVSFNQRVNEGIEGLSWDHHGQRLFVANEKNPLTILEIKGVDKLILGERANVSISIWNPVYSLANIAGDVSSISFNESRDSMTMLSHESRRVYRFDHQGIPRLILQLEKGRHGLRQSVSQPEGLAFGPDGSMYVVAEPNLFFRFVPN